MSRALPIASAATRNKSPRPSLSTNERLVWRALQAAVWLVGAGIVLALLVAPELGLHALWDVLIPVAPALLVFAPGVWRNVCPMATTALLPRRLGISRAVAISVPWQGRLAATGVVLLLVVVPLRHVTLDLNGPVTALVLLIVSAAALAAGALTGGKSGWCSGACPVHPVEKLYGQSPLLVPNNAHCDTCTRCVRPCPEAVPGGHPLSSKGSWTGTLAGSILVGGFPGYVYGWFQVPDFAGTEGLAHLASAYAWPFLGLFASFVTYVSLQALLGRRHQRMLVRVFAAAAVACYYWFRLPALFGFGLFPGDGMLVDLSRALPAWFPIASQITSTLLFGWLLVWRHREPKKAWTVRPPFRDAPPRVPHAKGVS